MIRRARVRGFKSLVDGEISLSPLTVLLGPNAAGKSNVLESLVLLSRLVTQRTLAEAFERPLRGYALEAFTLPDGGLAELLMKQNAQLSIEADIQPKTGIALRYRTAVSILPRSGALSTADEYLTRLKKDFTPRAMKPRIEKDRDHLVVRRLGQVGQPRIEDLGLNHTLVSNLQYSGETRYPDFDHLRTELSSWRMYFLDPRVQMRAPQPPRETSDIGTQGEWLAPFLYRLKEQHSRSFKAASRALHAAIPTIEGLDVDLDPNRGTLEIHITQSGRSYSSRIISEGTLRVLALCAIAANPWPASLVAFEEPENGVHPRRIEVVADLLVRLALSDQTQVLVTTHSPVFITAMVRRRKEYADRGLISLLQCSQKGHATAVEPFRADLPLFADEEIRAALRGDEDEILEAAFLRGWLDG